MKEKFLLQWWMIEGIISHSDDDDDDVVVVARARVDPETRTRDPSSPIIHDGTIVSPL